MSTHGAGYTSTIQLGIVAVLLPGVRTDNVALRRSHSRATARSASDLALYSARVDPHRERVLVIDDEPPVQSFLTAALSAFGYEVSVAGTGKDGFESAVTGEFDAIILDLRLPDIHGLDVVKQLHTHAPQVPVIVVSGFLDIDATVEMMKLGVADVLSKPMERDRLERALSAVMAGPERRRNHDRGRGVASRWARLVIDACAADRDLKTIGEWSRFVGQSPGTVREICRLVEISPSGARDFMRMLNALRRSISYHCPLGSLLDVSDRRTLDRLMRQAGLDRESDIESLRAFFERQQFLPRDHVAVQAVRQMLMRR